jgi:carbamoyl-phosphate synthase large subunit
MTIGLGAYVVMARQRIAVDNISLRAIEPRDIELIRQWRNAQINVLRQTAPISPEEQTRYFADHVWPEKKKSQPSQILLAIELSGNLIGYGGLVHISWPNRRAEVSFLLNPELESDDAGRTVLFTQFLMLVKNLAFDDLGLHRLTTETFAIRDRVIASLESCGFRREGTLLRHVLINGIPVDAVIHGCNIPKKGSASKNVLITSASHKTGLVSAMQRAAKRHDPNAIVVAGDTDPNVLSRYQADDFWLMPRTEDSNLSEIMQGCIARGIGAVLPTRDGELLFWARHQATFAEAGINAMIAPAPAVARCLDKLAFSQFAIDAGLPVIPAAETPETLGVGPFVVKERFGAGSKGVGLNLTKEAASLHAKTLHAPIFQQFVPGPEISIDGWIDSKGCTTGVVLRYRDIVSRGESVVTTTFRDTALESQAVHVLNHLGLHGPVVMQAILTSKGMQIIEVNPRFGGASTLSIAAGLDSFYWSLADAFGGDVKMPFLPVRHQIRQVRLPTDLLVYGSDF